MKIIAENISKTIKNKIILDDINLELETDKIYGLLVETDAAKLCFSERCQD